MSDVSSFSRYTAASSLVSIPTNRLLSVTAGSLLRTWTRSSILSLLAQPAEWDNSVSRTMLLCIENALPYQ